MFLKGYIVLFSESYYKGQTYYINTKRLEKCNFDLNDLYVGSIIIPSIYKQIRIEDNNGNTKPIISDVSNLNTNVTKMYVELEDPVILKYLSEGSVLLYTESSFKGRFMFISKNYVDRNDIEIRDVIGSLKIPDDLMVFLDTESIGYVGKIPSRSSNKYVTNIYIKKRKFIQFEPEPAPEPAIVPEPAPFKPSTSDSHDSTFIDRTKTDLFTLVPSTIKYTDYKVVIDNVTYYPGITAVDTKNKTSISNAQFFDEHGDIFKCYN